jgi:hypothetical protein
MASWAVTALWCGVACCESLEDAWSVAIVQNQRLAAAKMQQVAAAENLGAAAAERMPSVSIRSGYTVRSQEPSFVIRNPLPGLGTSSFTPRTTPLRLGDVRLPIHTSRDQHRQREPPQPARSWPKETLPRLTSTCCWRSAKRISRVD